MVQALPKKKTKKVNEAPNAVKLTGKKRKHPESNSEDSEISNNESKELTQKNHVATQRNKFLQSKQKRSQKSKVSRVNKKKRIINYPHSSNDYEQNIVENLNALFTWLHYDENGKHKSNVKAKCARCNHEINSFEKPGIKLNCCNVVIHGACKLRLSQQPRCEFCELKELNWTTQELRNVNLICYGHWFSNEKFIIALNEKIGWISANRIKHLKVADLAFDWLTNSVKVYGGEKQHVLVESDLQTDANDRTYHHYRIENGLEFFVYRYPGMSANNGKKLPSFDHHQMSIHN